MSGKEAPSFGNILAQVWTLGQYYLLDTYTSLTSLSLTWPTLLKMGLVGTAFWSMSMGVHLIRLHVKMESKTN